MASLLHRGMIHPMSIVYKSASEIQEGDSVIDFYGSYAEVRQITKIEIIYGTQRVIRLSLSEGTGYFPYYTHFEVLPSRMVRIPPVNPRVVYHD